MRFLSNEAARRVRENGDRRERLMRSVYAVLIAVLLLFIAVLIVRSPWGSSRIQCAPEVLFGRGDRAHSPAQVTTVLVTNCRQSAPKTGGIESVISSLAMVPELLESGIIVFDGAEAEDGVWLDEKCRGSCDPSSYSLYVDKVTSFAQHFFRIFQAVILPRRSCLTDALRSAWSRVETEHVFLLQDDLVIERPFPLQDILVGMRGDPRLGIVFLVTGDNIRFHIEYTNLVCGPSLRDRESISVGGLEYVESFQYNDQAQLTSLEFYDTHVWDKVVSGSFMEHQLTCADAFSDLQGKLWYLGKDASSRGYTAHIDGRNAT